MIFEKISQLLKDKNFNDLHKLILEIKKEDFVDALQKKTDAEFKNILQDLFFRHKLDLDEKQKQIDEQQKQIDEQRR